MCYDRCKTLNDNLRKHLIGGKIVLTQGIEAKTYEEIAEIMLKIRHFNNFTEANDPYNEHDFGSFDYKGEKSSGKSITMTKTINTYQRILPILM